jgi:hypothetical protein
MRLAKTGQKPGKNRVKNRARRSWCVDQAAQGDARAFRRVAG